MQYSLQLQVFFFLSCCVISIYVRVPRARSHAHARKSFIHLQYIVAGHSYTPLSAAIKTKKEFSFEFFPKFLFGSLAFSRKKNKKEKTKNQKFKTKITFIHKRALFTRARAGVRVTRRARAHQGPLCFRFFLKPKKQYEMVLWAAGGSQFMLFFVLTKE